MRSVERRWPRAYHRCLVGVNNFHAGRIGGRLSRVGADNLNLNIRDAALARPQ